MIRRLVLPVMILFVVLGCRSPVADLATTSGNNNDMRSPATPDYPPASDAEAIEDVKAENLEDREAEDQAKADQIERILDWFAQREARRAELDKTVQEACMEIFGHPSRRPVKDIESLPLHVLQTLISESLPGNFDSGRLGQLGAALGADLVESHEDTWVSDISQTEAESPYIIAALSIVLLTALDKRLSVVFSSDRMIPALERLLESASKAGLPLELQMGLALGWRVAQVRPREAELETLKRWSKEGAIKNNATESVLFSTLTYWEYSVAAPVIDLALQSGRGGCWKGIVDSLVHVLTPEGGRGRGRLRWLDDGIPQAVIGQLKENAEYCRSPAAWQYVRMRLSDWLTDHDYLAFSEAIAQGHPENGWMLAESLIMMSRAEPEAARLMCLKILDEDSASEVELVTACAAAAYLFLPATELTDYVADQLLWHATRIDSTPELRFAAVDSLSALGARYSERTIQAVLWSVDNDAVSGDLIKAVGRAVLRSRKAEDLVEGLRARSMRDELAVAGTALLLYALVSPERALTMIANDETGAGSDTVVVAIGLVCWLRPRLRNEAMQLLEKVEVSPPEWVTELMWRIGHSTTHPIISMLEYAIATETR